MRKLSLLIIALVGLVSKVTCGSEHFTLVASGPDGVYGYSQAITLQQGDTAQVVSGSLSGGGIMEVTIDGVTFEERITFWAGGQEPPGFRPIKTPVLPP